MDEFKKTELDKFKSKFPNAQIVNVAARLDDERNQYHLNIDFFNNGIRDFCVRKKEVGNV